MEKRRMNGTRYFHKVFYERIFVYVNWAWEVRVHWKITKRIELGRSTAKGTCRSPCRLNPHRSLGSRKKKLVYQLNIFFSQSRNRVDLFWTLLNRVPAYGLPIPRLLLVALVYTLQVSTPVSHILGKSLRGNKRFLLIHLVLKVVISWWKINIPCPLPTNKDSSVKVLLRFCREYCVTGKENSFLFYFKWYIISPCLHSCQLIWTEMQDILEFYCSSIVFNTIAYCFSIVFTLSKCGAVPLDAGWLATFYFTKNCYLF